MPFRILHSYILSLKLVAVAFKCFVDCRVCIAFGSFVTLNATRVLKCRTQSSIPRGSVVLKCYCVKNALRNRT